MLKKRTIGVICSCGYWDYVESDMLFSGKKRSCGKCTFNLSKQEAESLLQSHKLHKKTSYRQTSLYDL